MTAYEQGYNDYGYVCFPEDCPFEEGTRAWSDWIRGWEDADIDYCYSVMVWA